MRWSDERYVRVYTRDTLDWQSLSFIAQGLFVLLLRKVDRAGILTLGRHGKRGVATAIGFPGEWSRLEPALEELLADGSVKIEGECLVIPNFIEAQEAPASDAQRKRDQRERDRDLASRGITKRDRKSPNGTNSHGGSGPVTPGGHAESRTVPVESRSVTPNHAVPPVPPKPASSTAAVVEAAPSRIHVVDEGGPPEVPVWQAAVRFRQLVQDGMALTAFPAGSMSPADWSELDALVIRFGGPEKCAAWSLDKWRNRKDRSRVRNLGWFLAVLRDAPAPIRATASVFVGLGPNGEALYSEAKA